MTNNSLFPTYQYKINRTFSDKFERQIKRILGELFFINDFHKDVKENTDLMLLKGESFDFACRVRKHHYFEKYPNDITLRSKNKNGKETEMHKLMKGFGRFMFYGFCNEEETKIVSYRIIDLNTFRYKIMVNKKIREELYKKARVNKDGTEFKTFNIDDNSELIAYSSKKFPQTLMKI